jgi:flavin-dependent dehydrogenase
MTVQPRPLIIGSGIAGAAAAIGLARAGQRPLILERNRAIGDAICGGFLSWQSLAALERLGLAADQLGGQPVNEVRLFAGQRMARATLPHSGMGLSRRALDSALLKQALAAGASIEQGVSVRAYGAGWLKTGDGATLTAADLFVAHGKHGVAGHDRPAPPAVAADPVIGLRLRLANSPQIGALLGEAVELFLFDRGYVGLVRQEDGTANLCLAVHKSRLTESGGRPETLITEWGEENAALGERLAAAVPIAPVDAIAAIPYGWRRSAGIDGLWHLGDQAAVIPSLAGEGMGIALATAASAVISWRQGETSIVWQRRMARRLAPPMTLARIVWTLAEHPRWNGLGVALLRRMPMLTGVVARATRVPGTA